jgi:RHS repeat-associated protein
VYGIAEMTGTISKTHVPSVRRRRFEGLTALMLLAALVAPLNSQHSSLNWLAASGTEGCGPYSWDAAGRATGSNGYSPGARTNSSTVVLLGSVSTSSPTPTVTVSRNGVAMSGVTLNTNGTFNFADRPGQGWQTYLIQATQRGTGNGGSNAVAQQTRQVYVPPTNESLRYDSGGNRAGDSRWTLSWNSFGQLMEAKDANPSGSTDILFIYDYKGRMVQKLKSVNGTVVSIMRTLYDGWKPVLQIDSNGAGSELARRVYTWGPDVSGTNGGAAGIGGLIEMVEKKAGTTSTRLAIHDGKGNVTGWVDESTGARVATYSYGPFGEPVSASGSAMADCPLRWQTKLYDEDLGLYYFGKRWYDSKTRTWISPDPLREGGGVNVTCYCYNQPFDYCDAIGGAPITPEIRTEIIREIDEAGALVGEMAFNGESGTDLGRLRHAEFSQIMSNSKYADFLLTEQSINVKGGAVKMQKWGDGLYRWPIASKRPDLIVLKNSDYKAPALKGGGYDLQGKVEAAVDLKTGDAGIANDWRREVAGRLNIGQDAVFELRPYRSIRANYESMIATTEEGLGLGSVDRSALRVGMIPEAVFMLAPLYFDARDAAEEANDENPYVSTDAAGWRFAVGTSYEPIYFFLKSRFQREVGHFLAPMEGPFQGVTLPISDQDYDRLMDQMMRSGKTLHTLEIRS